MKVKILFFAKAKELAKVPSASFQVNQPQITFDSLTKVISEEFNLQALNGSFILALNEEYLEEDSLIELKEGDELAVIPPISGG